MPRTKSAHKALRHSLRRRAGNRRRRDAVVAVTRAFKRLLAERKFAEAQALVPRLSKAIDKAATRGRALNKNTARRKKSRLMAMLKKAAVPAAAGS